MQWLEWENGVDAIKNLSKLEKKMMLLPPETLNGIRITGLQSMNVTIFNYYYDYCFSAFFRGFSEVPVHST